MIQALHPKRHQQAWRNRLMANGTLSPAPLTSSNNHEAPAVLRQLCANAGIRINGDAPWDIRIHDPRVYREVLTRGSLGFGESYIEGMWDCDQLDELFARLL